MPTLDPSSQDLAQRIQTIRLHIARACARVGRDPAGVTLVAASKGHPVQAILQAMEAGQRDFGESYAQHLRDKARELGPGPTWHFIGPLQRNKVKYVVGTASLVHAMDSEALAREISSRSVHGPTPVLVEVNLAREESKHGVMPDQALDLCRRVHGLPGISLRGLMCLPPEADDPEEVRPWFRALARLAAEGRQEGLPLDLLSMGMSGDFQVAVEEGATHVRVGTAIFGPRT